MAISRFRLWWIVVREIENVERWFHYVMIDKVIGIRLRRLSCLRYRSDNMTLFYMNY